MSKESFFPHIVEAADKSGGSLPTIDNKDGKQPVVPAIDNNDEMQADAEEALVKFLGKHEGKKEEKGK